MTVPRDTYSPRYDLVALFIILASFGLRYWFVASGQLNLVQDEAQYWDWIRRPQLSYYSKGPLIAWVITLWTQVFGNTELGVRFGSVLGMTGILAALYVGVSRVWREYRMAVFVLFAAATMPLLNGLGILATTDCPLIFFWTVAFFALAAATRNEPDRAVTKWPFVVLGACMAFGILAKYMMLAFFGLALIHAIILQCRGQLPERFWSRFLLASVAGSALGLAPILLWNMDNGWVAYKHVAKLSAGVGNGTGFALRPGPFFEMLGAQIGLLAPWWLAFILVGTGAALRKAWIGPVGRFDAGYRRDLMTLLYFWPLWGLITAKALFSKVEANWTAAAFMAGAILAGMALKNWWDAPKRRTRGRAILAGTALFLTLAIYVSPLLGVRRPVQGLRHVRQLRLHLGAGLLHPRPAHHLLHLDRGPAHEPVRPVAHPGGRQARLGRDHGPQTVPQLPGAGAGQDVRIRVRADLLRVLLPRRRRAQVHPDPLQGVHRVLAQTRTRGILDSLLRNPRLLDSDDLTVAG
jgi:4-amino-4-deoxy-L-arabinose transferase-like glycosyltransferase